MFVFPIVVIWSPAVVFQHFSKSDKERWMTRWPLWSFTNPVTQWHSLFTSPSRLASYRKSLPPPRLILLTFAVFCSPSYFSLALTFCWNNYSPRDSHQALPKHCSLLRTKKRGYQKQKIHWFFVFFPNSVRFLFTVASFSFFSCDDFHADDLHLPLSPSHVPQYQTFPTALSYLMFKLPLTKTCYNARPPDTAELWWRAALSFLYWVA